MPPNTPDSSRRFTQNMPDSHWRQWAAQQAQLYLNTLQHHARVERHLRLLDQQRAARPDAPASQRVRAQQDQIGHLQREIGLQSEIARWGTALGLEETALRALRAIASLRDRIALLSEEIRAAPFDDALARLRAWNDALSARADLLRALQAPASDLQRLQAARVQALQAEASLLRDSGRLPDAERALAAAARLNTQTTDHPRASPIQEPVRRAIGGDLRHPERVSPLAVSEATTRRYIVEFQAPSDRGAAIVDALIDEVMRRLGDTLRAQR